MYAKIHSSVEILVVAIIILLSLPISQAAWISGGPVAPNQQHLISKTTQKDTTLLLKKAAQQEKLFLDYAENAWDNTRHLWDKANAIVRLGYGGTLLLYGCFFPTQIYAISVFKTSGWPVIKQGLCEISDTYKESRRVVKEKLPELMAAKEKLEGIREDIIELQAAIKKLKKAQLESIRNRGKECRDNLKNYDTEDVRSNLQSLVLTFSEMSTGLQEARDEMFAAFSSKERGAPQKKPRSPSPGKEKTKKEMVQTEAALEASLAEMKEELNQLNSKMRELDHASKSIGHIVEAINPEKLAKIFQGMYVSIATLIAGASANPISTNVKAITYGANIGQAVSQGASASLDSLSRRVECLEFMTPESLGLLTNVVTGILQSACVFSSVICQDLSTRVNTCVLGSTMVVDAMNDVAQQFIPQLQIPGHVESQMKAAMVASLTAAGFLYQANLLKSGLSNRMKVILDPLIQKEIDAVKTLGKAGLNICLEEIKLRI